MNLKNLYCLFFILSLISQARAQDVSYPRIHHKCPDFALIDESGTGLRTLSLETFRGKHVLLDFWSRGCKGCVLSFPELNAFQTEYKDRLTIISVGYEDPYIRAEYAKYRKKQHLQYAFAFDTTIFKRFKIQGVPHIIWVDDRGIVKAVSSNEDLTTANLELFLANQPFTFFDRSKEGRDAKEKRYDPERPLFINNNGGADTAFFFRSVLAAYDPAIEVRVPANVFRPMEVRKRLDIVGAKLSDLYRLAFTGYQSFHIDDSLYLFFYPAVQIRQRNSLVAIDSLEKYAANYGAGANLYTYSLIVPPARSDKMSVMRTMQNDLENYFGFKVSIEKKTMPCLKLRRINSRDQHLKTKGVTAFSQGNTSLVIKNAKISDFLMILWTYHQRVPFFDETDIDFRIDLELDALLSDLGNVNRALREKGLELVMGTRETNVIVLQEPQEKE